MRHWKPIVVAALVAVVVYMLLPRLPGDGYPMCLEGLRGHLGQYHREAGDYPRTAQELVGRLGPRKRPLGYELEFQDGDLVLFGGGSLRMEVEYRYVAPDTMPDALYPTVPRVMVDEGGGDVYAVRGGSERYSDSPYARGMLRIGCSGAVHVEHVG